jgi:Polysaccharide pyruvyl transferase
MGHHRDDAEHYPAEAGEGDPLVKALVSGWFSFEQMGATAGDLLARDLACEWLKRAGYPYDVAYAPPFHDGVNWRLVDPGAYSHVVFVCGPFGNGEPITKFLERFEGCRLVGLNLTMLESLDTWNPFDLLLERDSSATSNPDISFLSRQVPVPVVGVVLIDSQPEYKERDEHELANNAIHRLVASRQMCAVAIDTRLDTNSTGLRTASEVESLIARMDVVLTTRLHGTVLALKNGVPAVVIDPVAGGGKIRRQAETISWPLVFAADSLPDEALGQAFDFCLTEDARVKARECRGRAKTMVQEVRDEFVSSLARSRQMADD